MNWNGLTHISLFTGIGGIDLAAEWAGFETVLMVENNAYCQKVLKKHWPDVPILEDIKDATKERIMAYTQSDRESRGQSQDRKRQGIEQRSESEKGRVESNWYIPITLITGGFPCQPFSVAGKRRGKEDDRYLWPEMLRVIKEVRPRWVVAENVTGLLRMGFDDCISDLERAGFTTESFIIPACAVNAPHRRDRIFIVAHSDRARDRTPGSRTNGDRQEINEGWQEQPQPESSRQGQDVANTNADRLQDRIREYGSRGSQVRTSQGRPIEGCGEPWWESEPELGRVAHGIPHRVDRLGCLGNAVVPQQIYPILKAIADISVMRF